MANVIGRLTKASEIGSEITPPDDGQVLVVNPATNEVNRASVAAVRGTQSINDPEEIRDALEGLPSTPTDERLDASAIQNLPAGLSSTQVARLYDLWRNAPHTSPILWHGSYFSGHFASSWRGYNNQTDLTSAGLLGSVQHDEPLELSKITTNHSGTAEVGTLVNTNNRHFYLGWYPDTEHDASWIDGVRFALVYQGVIVLDRAMTEFSTGTQRTIFLSDAHFSHAFLTRPDNSVFDAYFYKKDDAGAAASLDDLLLGNVLPANLPTPTPSTCSPSDTQGLVESAVDELIDSKIRREFDAEAAIVTDIQETDKFWIQREGDTELHRVSWSTLANAVSHVVTINVPTATMQVSHTHNLGVYPTYVCRQASTGSEIVPSVTYDNLNEITFDFRSAFAGTIQLHG